VKLCIEFTSGIYLSVKGQINDAEIRSKKEFLLFDFKLPNMVVEIDDCGQKLVIVNGDGVEFVDFLNNKIDVVCGLDGLYVLGMYFGFVLKQQIVVSHKMLFLKLFLIDHKDSNFLAIQLMP